MIKILTVLLVTCFLGCSIDEASSKLPQLDQPTPALAKLNTSDNDQVVIPCKDGSAFRLETTEDPNRLAKNVNIVIHERIRNVINLPNQSEFNGFALNWAKKTNEGIEISIEYGSRHYFHKRFIFDCKQGELVLTRIKVESFDKRKPDKWTNKEVRVKPVVPIGKFAIIDYMKN